MSNVVAWYVVNAGDYNAGFLMLASIAACALTNFYWTMPETKEPDMRQAPQLAPAVSPMA